MTPLNIQERSRNTVDPQKQNETILIAAYPPSKCLRDGENRILLAVMSLLKEGLHWIGNGSRVR